jgi:carbon storage regulator CsrA
LNETIQIGTSLVRVVSIKRGQVRLGIEAAGDTKILRGELREQPAELINAGELAEV